MGWYYTWLKEKPINKVEHRWVFSPVIGGFFKVIISVLSVCKDFCEAEKLRKSRIVRNILY